MVLVFGGQRVVDVEGVVLLGGGLHRVLQLVLGIRIVLPRGGGLEGGRMKERGNGGGAESSIRTRKKKVHAQCCSVGERIVDKSLELQF